MIRALASLLGTTLLLLVAGCSDDPVQSKAIDALGKETPGGPGELHRAGQACGTCHQKGGKSSVDFSVAGTLFAGPGSLVGLEGARVDLVDSRGSSPPKAPRTNCVGNFFVRRSEWDPAFPIVVRVTKGTVSRTMRTQIGKEASCAGCHVAELPNPAPEEKVGHVYVLPGEDPQADLLGCAVEPDLAKR